MNILILSKVLYIHYKVIILGGFNLGIRIGGQAVVDGVMMRSDNYISTSIRKSDGSIKTRTRKFVSLTDKHPYLNFVFIRGIIMLFELMIQGTKELLWSSNESADENEKLTKKDIFITIILSILIVLLVFKLLPFYLAGLISNKSNAWYFNFIDATIKILIMAGYLYMISLISDVRTLYQYHGAEHKAVACFEAKKKLTPKNAIKFSRIHPRCGTTFVFLVFFISIFFYVLIPLQTGFWSNYALRIILLPLIAGVTYELIRLSGKYYYSNKLVRLLVWPGLQFQRITTREPSLEQLEVSIASLNACLNKERDSRIKNSLKNTRLV